MKISCNTDRNISTCLCSTETEKPPILKRSSKSATAFQQPFTSLAFYVIFWCHSFQTNLFFSLFFVVNVTFLAPANIGVSRTIKISISKGYAASTVQDLKCYT